MTNNGLRAAGLVLVVASTAGCESEQDAVPLARSLPVAIVMFVALPALWIGAHVLIRRIGRSAAQRVLGPSPARHLRWPALTAVLAAAPVVLPVAALWVTGCHRVAVGYGSPTHDLFAWDEWVVVLAILEGAGLIVGVVSTLVASALLSGRRRGVLASRWILGLLVLVATPVYVGLLWLPALVLAFVLAPPATDPRGRSVDVPGVSGARQPQQLAGTGWAPPALNGFGTEPASLERVRCRG